VLWSNQLLEEDAKLADLTLGACEKGGHWALIPDKLQIETKDKSFTDSIAELKSEYVQADVISFSAALLLHAVKHRQDPRLYSTTYGWCQDPRIGTELQKLESEALYGGGGPRALYAGAFDAFGLSVDGEGPGVVTSNQGCTAVWNFAT